MIGTLEHTVTIETTSCCQCGVIFGMPDYLIKKKRETGEGFYCPNGHSLAYTKSDAQRLREELMREKNRREQAEASSRDMSERYDQQVKENDRIKKRLHAGICPCCKRHFTNLERHMNSKHKKIGALKG